MDKGYVYAVERPDGIVKIGKTTAPELRIRTIELQAGFWAKRKMVSQRVDHYDLVELVAHAEFKDHRFIGEWFTVSFDDVVAYMQSKPWETEQFAFLVKCKRQRPKTEKFEPDAGFISSLFDPVFFSRMINPPTYMAKGTPYRDIIKACGLRSERDPYDPELQIFGNPVVRLYDGDTLVFEGRDYPDSFTFMEECYGLRAVDADECNTDNERINALLEAEGITFPMDMQARKVLGL